MKWLKLVKAYDGKAVGHAAEYDDSTADTLIKTGTAEACAAPDVAVDAAVNHPSLGEFVEKAVDRALAKHLRDDVAGKSRRPGYGADIRVGDDNELTSPTMGFKSIGEQVGAIRDYYMNRRQDERLVKYVKAVNNGGIVGKAAPGTFASEGLGADGGFALAPNFTNELLRYSFPDESLMGRCRKFTTSSNSLTVPKDETTPWGSTGVQVYWTGEGKAYTESKPAIGQDNLVLHKLTALVPVTDEMLSDGFMGIGEYVTQLAGDRLRWKADEAIVNGTGAGQPLGFATSGALVAQAKETGQAAGTVNLANVANMLSRIPPENMKNLLWLVHPKAFPQIVQLTNGNTSLWIAAGNVQTAGYLGTLFGIPVVVSQHCQTLGSQGDIYLVDLSKYLVLTKGGGIETAMSIHLYFDYSATAFRLNFRFAGQPWMVTSVTSAYGSYTMSPFVTLAAR